MASNDKNNHIKYEQVKQKKKEKKQNKSYLKVWITVLIASFTSIALN